MDIVERLRAWKQVRTTPYPIGYYLDTGCEAADEIERLRAEVANAMQHRREKSDETARMIAAERDRLLELLREAGRKLRDWHTEEREAIGGGMCEFQFCRSCGNRDFEPHKHDCRFVDLSTRIDDVTTGLKGE